MPDERPIFNSSPVPADASALHVSWAADPDAEAYIYCRLQVAVGPDGLAALLAGGLDLMMERFVLPVHVTQLWERGPSETGHRLLLARSWNQQLRPVEGLRLTPVCTLGEPALTAFGAPVSSWLAGFRVGGQPEARPAGAAPMGQGGRSRAFVEEPAQGAGRRPPTFVERPLSVRQGASLGARAQAPRKFATPLEAWDQRVRPRQERGGRLPKPDAAIAPGQPPNTSATTASLLAEEAPQAIAEEALAIRWALIGSDELTIAQAPAREALRALRPFLRVGLTGVADRAHMQRRADRIGVPLDGIFAMPADHPNLPGAVGCPCAAMVVFVGPEDPHPPGARRLEVTPDELVAVARQVVAEVAED